MKTWKKRILSVLMTACLSATMLPAAGAAEDEPVRGEMQYEQIIAPQYEDAEFFNEGLAAVEKNGKWGYIDETGAVVIPFRFDTAGNFSEGLALVGEYVENEYDGSDLMLSIIDKTGKKTPVYEGAEQAKDYNTMPGENFDGSYIFHNGYAAIGEGESARLISADTGRVVEQPDGLSKEYASLGGPINEGMATLYSVEGGYYGYYDLNAKKEIRLKAEEEYDLTYTLFPFNQGLAPVFTTRWTESGVDTKLGFVDKSGKYVIQPQSWTNFTFHGVYTTEQVFADNGIAMLRNSAGKEGGINKQGQTVIPFVYDDTLPFGYGFAPVQQNGKWGYIDETGKFAITAAYDSASGFSGDGYAMVVSGGEGFLIDRKGSRIPGQDKVDVSKYFIYDEYTGEKVVYTPGEIILIGEEGGYGYGWITYNPPLPEQSEVSGWAFEEVTAAIEENLVPNYLQNQYHTGINRAEFCNLTVQAVTETADKEIEALVQEKSGKSLENWVKERPFNDETDENVIAAYALGIVNGRGEGQFDPYTKLNRQEAAAFLMRAANVLGMDTGSVASAGYADEGAVSTWFRDAVNYVSQIGVMNGTGNNSFSPMSGYTREQSYMTIYRLFQAFHAE